MNARLACLVLVLSLGACGGDSGPAADAPSTDAPRPPDGGAPDGSAPDAAGPDGSAPDAAGPDGAAPDAATPDAATPDAATPDAATPDAATPDAAIPDASPPDALSAALVPGGGVQDPGVAGLGGLLHVFVIDARTGDPVAGASVTVAPAPGAATGLTGTTAADGLVTFMDASLVGPQVVTVKATGYALLTWVGVEGDNATIPIDPTSAEPIATVNGTLTWGLAAPSVGRKYYALIEHTVRSPFESSEGIFLCQWFYTDVGTPPCAYDLPARTGRVLVYARIFSCDSTVDLECMNPAFVGMAFPSAANRSLSLEGGDVVNNVGLSVVSHVDRSFTATLDVPPNAALTQEIVFPLASAGLEGLIDTSFHAVADATADGGGEPMTVPVFTIPGDAAAAPYTLLAVAQTPSTSDFRLAASFTQNVPIVSGGTITLEPYVGLPTNLSVTGATYAFTVPVAAWWTTAVLESTAGIHWTIEILDGSSSFVLPTLTPDPIPAGAARLRVQPLRRDLPATFDPQNWSFADWGGDGAISQNYLDFTH